jgi:hypothetical protein
MAASLMSARAYARRRGVSHTAVNLAVRSGRIPTVNGRIDPDAADRAWAQNTDESKPRNSVSGQSKKGRLERQLATPSAPAGNSGPGVSPAPGGGGSYATSRAVRESYLARTAKLEFEERIGKLISADESRLAQFTAARKARDMLLGLSAQLAPLLVGLSDVSEVERILTTELTRVCSAISAEVRK